MHVLLLIFYSFVLCYALLKIPFFRNSGIRPPILLLYFGLRVATGCLHNWIAYRYYPNHGDVWTFFTDSFTTRRELFTDVRLFWADNSTLAYLPHNLIEWMHVVFNFLSFDNLYINTLLFSFLALGGVIALFRVFSRRFGEDPLSSLSMLLLPSTLFWTTCIHTEGLVYPLLGFFFYYLDQLLARRSDGGIVAGGNNTSFLRCFFLFALAVFFRPAILIGLLPATGFWILAEKKQRYWIAIAAIAAMAILSFSPILHTLSARQNEFQQLTGNSRIELPLLQPTGASFLHVLPRALLNGLFQPLPGSGGQPIYEIFSAELIGIWLIIAYALIRRPRPTPFLSPFAIACLLFAVPGMLLVGYIIPFVGSIIRYRSLYLPFLLAPFLHTLRNQPIVRSINSWLRKYIVKSSDFK
jgi:hypothetical protein